MLSEFDIIKKFFTPKKTVDKNIVLGVGDDAALLNIPEGMTLVTCVDTLVAGRHFPEDTSPINIGYKALAVNLSDLAAMGAEPAWMTLALTLPEVDVGWLEGFSKGLFELADQYNMTLIGGDTTRGPLTITIQAYGLVPIGQAICRSTAKVGDKIYVSGTLGDAGLGLKIALEKRINPSGEVVLKRLNRPTPRIPLGKILQSFANSAIDISDGLLADLTHILKASQVGAKVFADQLPLSADLLQKTTLLEAQELALTAGDDYELCFTIPVEKESDFIFAANTASVKCTCIGVVEKNEGLQLRNFSGKLSEEGFEHFT